MTILENLCLAFPSIPENVICSTLTVAQGNENLAREWLHDMEPHWESSRGISVPGQAPHLVTAEDEASSSTETGQGEVSSNAEAIGISTGSRSQSPQTAAVESSAPSAHKRRRVRATCNPEPKFWVVFDRTPVRKTHLELLNTNITTSNATMVTILSGDCTTLTAKQVIDLVESTFISNETTAAFRKSDGPPPQVRGFWGHFFPIVDADEVWRAVMTDQVLCTPSFGKAIQIRSSTRQLQVHPASPLVSFLQATNLEMDCSAPERCTACLVVPCAENDLGRLFETGSSISKSLQHPGSLYYHSNINSTNTHNDEDDEEVPEGSSLTIKNFVHPTISNEEHVLASTFRIARSKSELEPQKPVKLPTLDVRQDCTYILYSLSGIRWVPITKDILGGT